MPSENSMLPLAALLSELDNRANDDLVRCFAADLQAFLTSFSLLSGRTVVTVADTRLLLERFRLSMSFTNPPKSSPKDFAPRPMPSPPPGMSAAGASASMIGGENTDHAAQLETALMHPRVEQP